MAFSTRVFYGYKISNNLSDVIDKTEALRIIGLNIGDLEVIRGASQAGALRQDVIAVSDLDVPIYKTLHRYIGDTNQYPEILNRTAGADRALFGNLTVNGAIGGSAVRYKYLDTETDEIKFTDISTSRTSAWSTTSGNPAESDPIFYGSQIKVKSGGEIAVNKITWGQQAEPREFDAEIPTHKITTTINGQQIKLYAMKSIPLKLEGFFRNFNGTVNINQINNLRVSWKIRNLINEGDIQRYANQGTAAGHTLRYRSVSAAPRIIEVYYPPDNIRGLTFTSIGLKTLPPASLSALQTLNISFNQIDEIPNINTFAPNLQALNISSNTLFLADTEVLRKPGSDAVNRLPTTLTSLTAFRTYNGAIRCVNRNSPYNTAGDVDVEITSGIGGANSMSVIEARFPNLVTLNLGKPNTVGAQFAPDNYDSLAHLPSVPNTCQNYNCVRNDFRRVPAVGLKERTNLRNLNLFDNIDLVDSNFSIASNVIETVDIGRTRLPIPDLTARTGLTAFRYRRSRNVNSLFTNDSVDTSYKFSGCTALRLLDFYDTEISGFIPKFRGNIALDRVDMFAAQRLTGGRPNNGTHGYADGTTFVMYKDTFDDCRDIRFFRVLSRSLLVRRGFEEGTFANLRNLDYLYWYSYRRTGSGGGIPLPDLSGCPRLRYLIMPVNNFDGPVPSMVSNPIIYYIDVSNNNLSGPIPQYTNRTNLRFLYLHNNNLTSFPGFANCPRLQNAYAHNNQIGGAIPNLSGQTPNLSRLYLFNNNLSSYTRGSFVNLTRIQILDLANNNLSSNDLDNIINDLFQNYTLAPRGRVTINLRGQSNAVGYNPSATGTASERTIRERLDFLSSVGWTINL